MIANGFEGAGGESIKIGSHRLGRAQFSEGAQNRFEEVAYSPARHHTVIG